MTQVRMIVSDISQWHGIEADVLDALLIEAYHSFSGMVGYDLEKDFLLTNADESAYPMVFSPQSISKDNDYYRVCLDIKDPTNWGMIIYQVTHMFCHAYCRCDRANVHKHHWFEEAICEAAAMSHLHHLQQHWDASPLAKYPKINARKERVFAYLEEVLKDVPRNIPTSAILQFINDNITVLEVKSITRIWDQATLRNIHGVSRYLCEQVFYQDVRRWKAVGYLNLWDASEDKNFINFIKNWIHHGDSNVRAVASALGVVIAETKNSV